MQPTPQSRTPAPVPFRSTEASTVLDLLRGLAAVLVLLDHTRHLFFGDPPLINPQGAHPWLFDLSEGLTNSGPQAVVIFFVLSGYLVAGSALRWMRRGDWSWRRYLIHRMVRLWLVLLPALVLGAVWDTLRVRLLEPASLTLEAAGLNLARFFGNLFFLQTIRTDTFGSNRVLWSLAFEFWFYLLFPLGALLLLRRRSLRIALGNAFLLLAVSWFIGHSILALFPVWLLGALLNETPIKRFRRPLRWAAAGFYVLMYILITAHPWRSHWLKPGYILGLCTAAFLLVVLSAREPIPQAGAFARVSRGLAGFSYSLYLVHYPFVALVAAALLHAGGTWSFTPAHGAAAVGVAGCALVYAWLVSRGTEAHTDAVRNWFEQRCLPHARAAELPGRQS